MATPAEHTLLTPPVTRTERTSPGPLAIAYPYTAQGGPACVGASSDWPSEGISCRTNHNPTEVYES